jgi:amino acid adenylation domain-containing protein
VVKEKPDSLALVFEQQEITYRQLDRRANRIAHRLCAMGVGAEVCVGLYVDRCIDMIVGILGILKAGGAYVPLDTAYPIEHIRFILEDANLSVVLTQQALLDSVPEISARAIAIETFFAPSEEPQDVSPPCNTQSENLAYVIYTSGSTGKPKGVMVTHLNLVHSTTARINFYRGDVGRFLLLSSFAFDSSVAGIFWSLCTGGALVLPAGGLEQDTDRLALLIADRRVTHLLCLPVLYKLILEYARRDQLTSLKVVMVAGEACPSTVVKQHLTLLPQTSLYNEYGPTEATVWSTVHRVAPDDQAGPVPIGRPIANTQAYLLDQHQHLVPVGVCGEIYLSGMGLARGYLNRPELTAQRFVSLPSEPETSRRMYRTGDLACYRNDGRLLFLGRADSQVKIRGYRVELGGIEETLVGYPDVGEAGVVLQEFPAGAQRKRLIAYIVCDPAAGHAAPADTLESRLQDYLSRRLPDYMLPERLVILESLPKLPNGKTDYNSLPEPEAIGLHGEKSYREPRTDAETILAGIWAELLGLQ